MESGAMYCVSAILRGVISTWGNLNQISVLYDTWQVNVSLTRKSQSPKLDVLWIQKFTIIIIASNSYWALTVCQSLWKHLCTGALSFICTYQAPMLGTRNFRLFFLHNIGCTSCILDHGIPCSLVDFLVWCRNLTSSSTLLQDGSGARQI